MNIQDLTVKQCCEIAAVFGARRAETATDAFWVVGKCYFIRTITHHYTGRLVAVTPTALLLEDAAWIADDGRFADAVRTGMFSEVEPFPDGLVYLGLGTVLDACAVLKVPREQK